jgi:Putative beta-lactamase-inhibitor-like, PepSY-like
MKKTFFALVAACLSLAAFSQSASAQGYRNVIYFSNSKHFMNSLSDLYYDLGLTDPSEANASTENIVNSKAVKDFNGRFDQVSEAKWFEISSGYCTYFLSDGFQHRAFYDKKGHWQSTLKFFSEDNLPKAIRKTVRSNYTDYSITMVEEVDVASTQVYIIYLENGTSFKNLRVSKKGDMNIIVDLKK